MKFAQNKFGLLFNKKNDEIDLDSIIIRLVRKHDLPALEWDGQFKHYRNLYAEAFERQENGLGLMWIATLPFSKLVGQIFIQFICNRPELANGTNRAYFYSLRIKDQYRNQGIGSKLISWVENDLKSRGVEFLTLNVTKENTRAIQLYERMGYKIKAHEEGRWFYKDHKNIRRNVHEPSWRMEKLLE
ncbi:MAG: GNAT family N-acetyltransferase [Anaerolineaceae bacterium]|nr:GNAT family N-acetyltransferase [Anaerolineaceae bacterium]